MAPAAPARGRSISRPAGMQLDPPASMAIPRCGMAPVCARVRACCRQLELVHASHRPRLRASASIHATRPMGALWRSLMCCSDLKMLYSDVQYSSCSL